MIYPPYAWLLRPFIQLQGHTFFDRIVISEYNYFFLFSAEHSPSKLHVESFS
jgi:hypothetical protein